MKFDKSKRHKCSKPGCRKSYKTVEQLNMHERRHKGCNES